MTVADNLRKICAAARPAIEAALDAAEELSEIRDAASEQGLDWSQVKALLKAQIQDERDGGHRVEKLVAKADIASTYAAMLSADIGAGNVAQKQKTTTQSKVSRETPIAAPTNPRRTTRGDEAVLSESSTASQFPPLDTGHTRERPLSHGLQDTVPAGRSAISEAAPALGDGGDRTDAASSHSATNPTRVSSLATRSGGGNLAGTETSGHSLSETDAVTLPHSIAEPAGSMGLFPSGEIEPARETGLHAGSPISDPDPRDDIKTNLFIAGV